MPKKDMIFDLLAREGRLCRQDMISAGELAIQLTPVNCAPYRCVNCQTPVKRATDSILERR